MVELRFPDLLDALPAVNVETGPGRERSRAAWRVQLRLASDTPRPAVISLDGRVLYDVAVVAEDEVEDMIDEVGIEYLDLLLDLTGDDFMGAKSIEAWFLVDG